MRSMVGFEIRRLVQNKVFIFIYALFLLVVVSTSLLYDLSKTLDYKSLIGVLNLDGSAKTEEFIQNLNSGRSIETMEFEKSIDINAATEYIKQGKVGAVLVIPEGFFRDLPKSKLTFISAEGDAVSPALIDLISQAFIMDVIEKELGKRVEVDMGISKVETSILEYNDLKTDSRFDLEIIEKTENEQRGLISEQKQETIDNALSIIMYIAAFTALFVSISLHISTIRNKGIVSRMFMTPSAGFEYYISKRIIDFILLLLPILFSSAVFAIKLNMMPIPYLFFVFGASIGIFFVFELGGFFYSKFESGTEFSLAIFASLFLALVGGSFFSLDMLPEALKSIASLTPFSLISSAFYGATDMDFSIMPMILVYLVLLLFMTVFNYRSYSK